MSPMIPGIRKTHVHGSSGTLCCRGIAEALQADDAELSVLFGRFIAVAQNDNPPLPAVRDRLARCICDMLASQRLAEQEVLYPEIGKESDKLVFAFLLADEGIAMRIAEIRDCAAPQFKRDLAVLSLIAMVRRYMLEREQILFPLLRTRLSATCMEWLGADYAQRRGMHAAGVAAERTSPQDRGGDGVAIPADAARQHLAWRMRDASEEARRN